MTDFSPFTPIPPVTTGSAPLAPPATEPTPNGRRKRGPRRVAGAAKAAKKPGRPRKVQAEPQQSETIVRAAPVDELGVLMKINNLLIALPQKSRGRIISALAVVFA